MCNVKPLTIIFLVVILLFGCSKNPFSRSSGSMTERDLAASDANIPLDMDQGLGLFRNIYFDFDSAEITPQSLEDLRYNLDVLRSNSSLIVTLEGHCDVRGTREYNYALGQRRANAVKNWLVSNGIPESRLKTVSFGSDAPLSLGNTEEDHAMNRRVHFRY